MKQTKAYVGCSGYHYEDWEGKFYPGDVKKEDWLAYYSETFNSVEINNSFYKLPDKETFSKWKEMTPEHFRFTLKGSRYITHMKKLKDPKTHVRKFLNAIDPLAGKTDCILWQLPGNLHLNEDKLDSFCQVLSKDFIHVMEFRHASWFTEATWEVLSNHEHMAACSLSAPGDLPEDLLDINGVVYIRFHGKNEWYHHRYAKKELKKWITRISKSDDMKQLYAYFNNDVDAHAPENAGMFKEMVEKDVKES